MTTTISINDARAEWAKLDRAAKVQHLDTESFVNETLERFQASHGRMPAKGDVEFDAIEDRFAERDRARFQADQARERLDMLARANEVPNAPAGPLSSIGTYTGNAPRPGQAFVEAMQRSDGSAQKSASASVPSFLSPLTVPQPQAAFDGTGPASPTGIPSNLFSRIPHRRTSLLSLIPSEPIADLGGATVNYLKQTVYTNNAAVTAHLGTKPETVLTITRETETIHTIAHISGQIPRQLLVAYRELEGFVDDEMSAGVLEACESLTLDGTGTGEPTGIYNTSGIQTVALATMSRFAALRRAIRLLEDVNVAPDAIVMAPTDFEDLEGELNAMDDFQLGGPRARAVASIWRVPVVVSTAATSGTPIVGNFARGARWWDGVGRAGFTEAVASDARANALRFLSEQGFGFAVARPNHFVTITGF